MAESEVVVRSARRADLTAIIGLFADDELGAAVGIDSLPWARHGEAFDEIQGDPNNKVYVAELGGSVVGTFQLTFIRQLSYGGCRVAQIESVHVHSSVRSRGVGRAMMESAVEEARRRGCIRVQLTTNARRMRAHRFYERLGFSASHKGLKLYLK